MYSSKQNRKRMFLSFILAFIFHGLIFVSVQYFIPLETEAVEEYKGPLIVTIDRPIPSEPVKVVEELSPKVQKITEREVVPEKREKLVPETSQKDPVPKIATEDKGASYETYKPFRQDTEIDMVPYEKYDDAVISPTDKEGVLPRIPSRSYEEEESKNDQDLPFQSQSETQEETLAFKMDRLDQAIDGVEKTGTVSEEVEKEQKIKKAPPAEELVIVWDDASSERMLTYAGPDPKIPSWVQKEGLTLKSAISFAVTPEGHTTSVHIRISSGYSDVDTALLNAVRKMKFNPEPGNKRVTGTITYIISPK
jgi:TonB family protein